MNGKPDEHLDEWVRQSLSRLPNTPPPGTTFDAERLWTRMRPDLQKTPSSRQRGWVWWSAAACVLGAVLGWFMLNQPQRERSRPITHARGSNVPTAINREPNSLPDDKRFDEMPVKQKFSLRPLTKKTEERISPAPAPVLSSEITEPPVAYSNELPVSVRADSIGQIPPEKAQETVVSAPNRRFRVVHFNELQAEEEIRPTTYRTEGFVRLGLGNIGLRMPETDPPSIILPITNKPIQ